LTPEGFVADFAAKAEFLLSLRACWSEPDTASHATPALNMAVDVTETVKLIRVNRFEHAVVIMSRGIRDNKFGCAFCSSTKNQAATQSFKSLFNLYQTLQHWSAYQQSKRQKKVALLDLDCCHVT